MVLLRLEVRVFPREAAPTFPPTNDRGASNPSIFSRIVSNGVGNRNKESSSSVDRSQEGSYDHVRAEANPVKEYASFLLLLRDSDQLSLGDLARRIANEWASFRSDQEPLEIKKLLDDANPTVDLSLSMTVADVFVDTGKALADGHDQRAIVRVIQKPAPAQYAPQRFPSVVQDWDGAAQNKAQTQFETRNRFSPIAEEEYAPVSAQKSPDGQQYHDAPLPSVESHIRYNRDEIIPGTPTAELSGSEELGNSPSPERSRVSKKRKQSPRGDEPVKQRRLENEATQIAGNTTPSRKRVGVPTFASPHRRPSLSEKATADGIGLGVTKSPFKKPAMPDASSSQNGPSVSTPVNHPAQSGNTHLHSALRKPSPASNQSHKRRSVSFNDPMVDDEATQPTSGKTSKKAKTTRQSELTKSSQKTPASGSKGSSYIPSSSNMTPTDPAKMREMDDQFARIQREIKEKASLRKQLEDPETEPAAKTIIKEMLDIFAQIAEGTKNFKGKDGSQRPINRLKRRLAPLRKKLDEIVTGETEEETQKEAQKETQGETQKEPPLSQEEPPLPTNDARVTRSMPSPAAPTPPVSGQAPNWSFGNVTSSTQKAPTQDAVQPSTRRQTRSSARSSQASEPKESVDKSPPARFSQSPSVVIHNSPKQGPSSSASKTPAKTATAVEPVDVEMENVDEHEDDSANEATENSPQHASQEEPREANAKPNREVTEEATDESSDSSESSESSEESDVESDVESNEELPDTTEANSVDEQDNGQSNGAPQSEPLDEADLTDEQDQSEDDVMANGLIDGEAEEDDEDDDDDDEEDEEGDDEDEEEMDGFIDDGAEETGEGEEEEEETGEEEEEHYEDAEEHGDSAEDIVDGKVDAQGPETEKEQEEESDKSNIEVEPQGDEVGDEGNKAGDEYVQTSQENKSANLQPANGAVESDDESSTSEDSESDEEDYPFMSQPNRLSQNTPKPAAPRFVSSQPKTTTKTTLKSLLQAAKEESTRQNPSPVTAAKRELSNSNSKPKPSVWEYPSDDESESDESEQGDILPNGDSRKPRKPYSQQS